MYGDDAAYRRPGPTRLGEFTQAMDWLEVALRLRDRVLLELEERPSWIRWEWSSDYRTVEPELNFQSD